MIIAVIGNYELPEYKEFLEKVKIACPEEEILDLSRHPGYNWGKKCKARFEDISSSHRVIINEDYKDFIDSRRDVSYAMQHKRTCFIYVDRQFKPFPSFARSL